MQSKQTTLRIAAAIVIILGTIGYLAYTGARANKFYYVTIAELQNMGGKAYTRHLRVAGNVQPGSIQQEGSHMHFVLVEQGNTLRVNYTGMEPPPDTFKDNAQALAIGTYGRDGVFHATQIQAKCASKYAPAAPKTTAQTIAPAVPAVQTN